jgi:hypothetical protein
MAALWEVKQGDTCPPLAVEMTDDYGNALPRPNSVKMVMFTDTLNYVDDAAEVLEASPVRLWVQYSPDGLTLDNQGEYYVEWLLTYAGGRHVRVPTDGYDLVRVLPKGSA